MDVSLEVQGDDSTPAKMTVNAGGLPGNVYIGTAGSVTPAGIVGTQVSEHRNIIQNMHVRKVTGKQETPTGVRIQGAKKVPVVKSANSAALCTPGKTIIKDRWRVLEAVGAGMMHGYLLLF